MPLTRAKRGNPAADAACATSIAIAPIRPDGPDGVLLAAPARSEIEGAGKQVAYRRTRRHVA